MGGFGCMDVWMGGWMYGWWIILGHPSDSFWPPQQIWISGYSEKNLSFIFILLQWQFTSSHLGWLCVVFGQLLLCVTVAVNCDGVGLVAPVIWKFWRLFRETLSNLFLEGLPYEVIFQFYYVFDGVDYVYWFTLWVLIKIVIKRLTLIWVIS